MRITKFKKFTTWNLISLIGYLCFFIAIYFIILFTIASAGVGIRPDLDKYFYKHIFEHVLSPYLDFYRIQLIVILLLLFGTKFEAEYNKEKSNWGLHLFEERETTYSAFFVIGLVLNLFPMYIVLLSFLKFLMKMH